jgi:hypothetical protein
MKFGHWLSSGKVAPLEHGTDLINKHRGKRTEMIKAKETQWLCKTTREKHNGNREW